MGERESRQSSRDSAAAIAKRAKRKTAEKRGVKPRVFVAATLELAAERKARKKATLKAWKKANAAAVREYNKKYCAEHAEEIAASQRAYKTLNADAVNAKQAEWNRCNQFKRTAAQMKRHASKLRATPAWADLQAIEDVYKEAAYFGMWVDHIVPLQSKLVCGLHVWENLQLLTSKENIVKGNRHWPDMPHEIPNLHTTDSLPALSAC